MKIRRQRLTLALLVLVASSAGAIQAAAEQPPARVPLPEAVVKRLPAAWHEVVAKFMRADEEWAGQLAKLDDFQLRGRILASLSFETGPEEFVLDHVLEPMPKQERLVLVVNIPWQEHWWSHLRADTVLSEMALSEPDQELAMAALDAARGLEMRRLQAVLRKRIDRQKESASPEVKTQLEEQDERWISLVNGTMLPAFLRQPPPVFSVKPGAGSVRVLAFGDFGFGAEAEAEMHMAIENNQKKTSAAMLAYHRQKPFDFGITLGDNFYGDGMHSPSEARWKTSWEDLYGPLGIKFYPAFGNHDWYHPDSPAAELLYTSKSGSWDMRAPYYTFTAGPVQFFAIDTNEVSKAQIRWLTNELAKSQARWKVVYGHFPPYYSSPYGGTDDKVVATLMPILKGRADVYFAGHHHSLQHLKPVDGVNLFIAGGGGAPTYPVDPKSDLALFAKQENGFAIIEADENSFIVRFVNKDSQQLYETTLRKPPAQAPSATSSGR